MKVLLDTHAIIWALTDDMRLTDEAIEIICDKNNLIYYSVVSIWEIAIKNQKNEALCPYNETVIDDLCKAAGFRCLDVKFEHVAALRDLQIKDDCKLSNKDPFDRILLAQAKTENCSFLTFDDNFVNYNEPALILKKYRSVMR